eukprot:scaffold94169_cov62-Attheya_sp.AAC.5
MRERRQSIRPIVGKFHNSSIVQKPYPMPVFIAEKWDRDGFRLPTKTRKQLEVDTGLAVDYTITCTGPQKASVKCVHSSADPHVHDIDLSTPPFQWSQKCLERDGKLCSFAIMFIKYSGLDPVDFVPEKYTVAGGIKFLKVSLGQLETESKLHIKYADLNLSCPPIIPPHSQIPKGQLKKKQMTKDAKRRWYLVQRDERRSQKAAEHETAVRITMRNCHSPHDGMGNYISTSEQNAYLEEGFLIIEMKGIGQTVLPQNLQEFEQMRLESSMSTTSFNKNDVLSDLDDGDDSEDDRHEEDPDEDNGPVFVLSGNRDEGIQYEDDADKRNDDGKPTPEVEYEVHMMNVQKDDSHSFNEETMAINAVTSGLFDGVFLEKRSVYVSSEVHNMLIFAW